MSVNSWSTYSQLVGTLERNVLEVLRVSKH